ncbi:hypothetical protein ACFL9U_08025 [Thermodesulfobacteriota bacterium]
MIIKNRDDSTSEQMILRLARTVENEKNTKEQTDLQSRSEEDLPPFRQEMSSETEIEFESENELSPESFGNQPEKLQTIDEAALQRLQDKGMIQISPEGEIRITSRGARALAHLALREILEELTRRQPQQVLEKIGCSASIQPWTRKYTLGDSYENVNVERTLLNSASRKQEKEYISLSIEDFEIHESRDEDRVLIGLLIDESRSMHKDGKLRAALDTAMALSELVIKRPRQELKVFTFSDSVMEISFWEILNKIMEGGSTDQRSALEAFRKTARGFEGQKEIYLITDSEPNSYKGKSIRFQQAMLGLLDEAIRLRKENITLNIIMLDDRSLLKGFAQDLAQRNLGRVFFTSPNFLGRVVIEDYIKRQERPLWRQNTNIPLDESWHEPPLRYPYYKRLNANFWE